MKPSIDSKNNAVTFSVSTKIYSKDVVYKACYVFIDRMYVFLGLPAKKDAISVTLKGKSALTRKGIERLEGEFMNELLNALVRENVSKRNQKVLEQIVGGAMGAALGIHGPQTEVPVQTTPWNLKDDAEIENAIQALRRELETIDTEDDYESDALGIRTVVVESAAPEPPSRKKVPSSRSVKIGSSKKPANKRHAKKK